MCEASKHSLQTTRVKKFKTQKSKEWLNKSYSRARVLFKQAANKANKYLSEPQFTED